MPVVDEVPRFPEGVEVTHTVHTYIKQFNLAKHVFEQERRASITRSSKSLHEVLDTYGNPAVAELLYKVDTSIAELQRIRTAPVRLDQEDINFLVSGVPAGHGPHILFRHASLQSFLYDTMVSTGVLKSEFLEPDVLDGMRIIESYEASDKEKVSTFTGMVEYLHSMWDRSFAAKRLANGRDLVLQYGRDESWQALGRAIRQVSATPLAELSGRVLEEDSVMIMAENFRLLHKLRDNQFKMVLYYLLSREAGSDPVTDSQTILEKLTGSEDLILYADPWAGEDDGDGISWLFTS